MPRVSVPRLTAFALIVLWALLFATVGPALAAPANPHPFPLQQPDGTTFLARMYGDEWNNGFETLSGYTILQDPATGYWVYATLDGWGNLAPTTLRVGLDAPKNLTPHLREQRQRPLYAPPLNSIPRAPWPGVQGTLPTLFILVEFNDQKHVGSNASDWAAKAFGTSGSVKDYYNEVSYGKLQITPAADSHGTTNDGVIGWLTLNQNHPNTGNSIGDANRQLAKDAIIAADPYINYSAYDTDNDGYLSSTELLIVVIVAGYEYSYGSSPCGPGVWGHRWSLYGSVSAPQLDGVYVGASGGGGYGQFGEWHCRASSPPGHIATIGIMVHEIGHLLNWPDLYDPDYSSEGVGVWSVMGSGSWGRTTLSGDTPAHPDAFSKVYQGWITPTLHSLPLSSPATENLAQVETNASVLQVRDNPNDVDWNFGRQSGNGEYFLIENRQQTGYDASLPGCGILLWHIDESVTYSNSANADENHPLVKLMEADGKDDLKKANNRGDAGDPFPGSSNNTLFSDTTNPSSKLYNGDNSLVKVEILTSGCSSTMQVRISSTVNFSHFIFLPIAFR